MIDLFTGWHSVENASCAADLCHRCLKQYAKLYKGEIKSISRYCPLDLFSGDEMRMKTAIFDLFERPHNRFKVFKNGRILYTESTGNPQTLQQELQAWLGPKTENEGKMKDDGKNIHRLASLLCTALLSPFETDGCLINDSVISTNSNIVGLTAKEGRKKNIFYATKNFDITSFRSDDPPSINSPAQRQELDNKQPEQCKFHSSKIYHH